MSCCNSNCNHDPCGSSFNQSLTRGAQYAQYAQTQANKAEDLWLEFNALYLGAFAVAPTQDNEGNPLQTGALYFNSVTTDLWVWDGTAWIPDAFNEFTPFLATATTTARNLVTRFRDVANVKDFGAVGDGIADDTTAIQTAINFNAGGCVYFPRGRYRITNKIVITSDKTSLVSDFVTCAEIKLDNTSASAALEFKSSVSGGSLFANSLINMVITGTPSSNYQVGVYLERTQDFTMTTCGISDFATCLKARGGFNCRYNSLRIGPNLSTNADIGEGAIEIGAATVGTAFDGYTHQFVNCHISGNKTEYAIVFRGNDYATFSNCYVASGTKGGVLIEVDSSSPFGNYNNNFDNIYFDSVRSQHPSLYLIAININDQTSPPPQNATSTKITDCVFTEWDKAININKSFDPAIEISGCKFSGQREAAIDATGGFTNLVIGSNQFHNNTATTSGNATIDILNIHSVSITGNVFSFLETATLPGTRDVIRLGGIIDATTITGNAINRFNAANVTDFANTATITNLVVTGNASDNPNNTLVGHLIGNQANSNRFMLDWYEESFPFNPTLTFGGNSVGLVLGAVAAKATRIGDRVLFNIYLELTNKGTSTGIAAIGGLPFTQSTLYPQTYTVTCNNLASGVGDANLDAVRINSPLNSINIRKQSGGITIALTDADFTNTTNLSISGNYLVA